jgi:Raf kinase inhibitor-like YbhB/YbcL family protein
MFGKLPSLGAISPLLAILLFAGAIRVFAKNSSGNIRVPGFAVQGATMAFAMSSLSFPNNAGIPAKFTCDGADVSPEFSWTGTPAGTQSFALVAEYPDAPGGAWTHWVLFDLPAGTTHLSEGVAKVEEITGGGRQGRNDFRKIGYGGPCPPPGKPHRYFFKLYAVDKRLNLPSGSGKQDLEQALQGHILGKAEWMGRYQH